MPWGQTRSSGRDFPLPAGSADFSAVTVGMREVYYGDVWKVDLVLATVLNRPTRNEVSDM